MIYKVCILFNYSLSPVYFFKKRKLFHVYLRGGKAVFFYQNRPTTYCTVGSVMGVKSLKLFSVIYVINYTVLCSTVRKIADKIVLQTLTKLVKKTYTYCIFFGGGGDRVNDINIIFVI